MKKSTKDEAEGSRMTNGCILRVSSHTPSAVPAMGDGSCANRRTSRRTGCDISICRNLTGAPTGMDGGRTLQAVSETRETISKVGWNELYGFS